MNTKRGRLPKVLVMAPTRELAKQVATEFESVANHLSCFCIYGGMPYENQENALRKGLDIVIGTPGRLIDHIDRGNLKLDEIEFVILDEADQMLNFGFAEDMEKILKAMPKNKDRQTLLFSATIPDWVKKVSKIYLKPNYKTIDLVGNENVQSNENIEHLAILCHWKERSEVLADVVKLYGGDGRTIIFANTKNEATELSTNSSVSNSSGVLHGDIVQKQREITLAGFREGSFKCLIATDVAARGLDIPEVDLVIQTQPPEQPETFIHRVGRTARAGRCGTAILFFTKKEVGLVKQIEKVVGIQFKRIGVPQAASLMESAAEKNLPLIESVSEEMIPYFAKAAKKLIDSLGPEKALAATLAHFCGYSQPPKKKSLLSSLEGYVTLQLLTSKTRHPKAIVSSLERWVPANQVRDITPCQGGYIMDVPQDAATAILEFSEKGQELNKGRNIDVWKICHELPDGLEIKGFNDETNGFSRSSHRGRGNGNFQRGSFRGRGRGRGHS